MDTIFALSSGSPPAAIAIVRLSGSLAYPAATALAGTLPPPRTARLRMLRDPRTQGPLDRALVLVFPAPRTATGEDLVELHVHGGRAVVAAVSDALAALPGLRRAEPGEFTRRALSNGVIDLTEAEGLADLLAAETEGQRRAAMRIAEGSLRVTIEAWTQQLLDIAGEIEAQLDFSDEDDVPRDPSEHVPAGLARIVREMDDLLSQPPVERLRDGMRVVLAGPPNSGKSTLLNALTGRDVAIVSPIAGTTRDRIDAPVMRDGIAFVLTDTAGIGERTSDPIEQIGIARAHAAMTDADIVLWLGDDPVEGTAMHVHARADLNGRGLPPTGSIAVSALSGMGLPALWQAIMQRSRELLPNESMLALNVRQRAHVSESRAALDAMPGIIPYDIVLVAEHVRLALRALDAVVGRAGIEDVLDALFAKFCIGK